MSLVESWSAIHCLAGRMLKEYVSKHSEYKGEAIDYDALVLKAKEDLSCGRFDQSEREFPLNVFQGKDDFEEGVEYLSTTV